MSNVLICFGRLGFPDIPPARPATDFGHRKLLESLSSRLPDDLGSRVHNLKHIFTKGRESAWCQPGQNTFRPG